MKLHARAIVPLLISTSILTSAFPQSNLPKTEAAPGKPGVSNFPADVRVSGININNLWLQICNDGRLGLDTSGVRGLTYPFFEGGLLYNDNIFWTGKVSDGRTPLVRSGGGTYALGVGVRPGSIISKGAAEDPQSTSTRVFRYRSDYLTGDLTFDAAASKGVDIAKVTPDMVAAVRENYKKDFAEWPWKKGAPFADANHNGAMDPGETPGIQNASQLAWFSYNDLDETVSKSLAGDPPYGMEVQVTVWAYKGSPNLEDVIFKRYRLIYKGTALTPPSARIDSMYLTHWADPDIGSASDDLGGCDSLLDLGYGYNGTYNGNDQDRMYQALGLPSPGLGYTILQGPMVPGLASESATFNFGTRSGFKNLPMTSFGAHITGLGDGMTETVGIRSLFYWNEARGYKPTTLGSGKDTISSSTPWLDYQKIPSRFMYSGDPVSRTGWIATRPTSDWYLFSGNPDFVGGDLRIYMNMGPFAMAPGDTQEVVIATIASAAPTSVENATWLKNRARYVRAIYPNLGDYAAQFVTAVPGNSAIPNDFTLQQNYPNPFNPTTQIRFTIPQTGEIALTIYDVLGRETKALFRGVLAAGEHVFTWDSRKSSGESAPSGVYFYRLQMGDRQFTRNMVLLR